MKKSIIICGPPAVGKTTIAKSLAKEFGVKYLGGGDILKQLAKEEGFDTQGDDWWDTPDGMEFLNRRKKNPNFDKKVDEKLEEIFLKGNVVITSYTMPWLVEDGIKIWLDGSIKNSAERMQKRDKMDFEKAVKIVEKRYEENKKLYKKLYGFNFGKDPKIFDKIIKTDGLDANQVFEIAKSAVKELL